MNRRKRYLTYRFEKALGIVTVPWGFQYFRGYFGPGEAPPNE
jgi:hypothetical protein